MADFDIDAFLNEGQEAPVHVAAPTRDEKATSIATEPPTAEQVAADRRASARAEFERGKSEDAATAFRYGVQRGAVPGIDRLVGIGTDLGDALASAVQWSPETGLRAENLPPPAEDTAQKAREEYLRDEALAAKNRPFLYGAGQVVGSGPMTVGTAGAGTAVTGPATVAKVANSPMGRLATQNFATGYMNSPSDNPVEQARAGLMSAAAGEVAGVGGEKVAKFLGGAVSREYRGLVKDIMRNSETDVAATATARKRFMERATAAVDEVKADKAMEKSIRAGDAEHVANMARSKLEIISEPRAGMYKQADSIKMVSLNDIDKAIADATTHSTGAEHAAFVAMRKELHDEWVPKWKAEGYLTNRGVGQVGPGGGQTMLPHVSGLGVREWVTKAQNASSMVIGGLEEGPRKIVKNAMEDVAEDVWRKHLDTIAKSDKQLVQNIRTYDKRASGLMAIETIMEQRARKDAEGIMGFGKKYENKLDALVTSGAGLGALAGHPAEAVAGLAAYQAAKRIPRAASAINDKILAPLQRKAMAGAPVAELINDAAAVGLPQGMARAIWNSAQRARGNSTDTNTSTATGIGKVSPAVANAVFGPRESVSTATSTAVR